MQGGYPGYTKKLLCNMKKPFMEYPGAFTEYQITKKLHGIPRSFYGIQNYQEALSNTMKLDGIPRGFDENLV